MWYFAWALGVTMAVLLAAVNAMWCESLESARQVNEETGAKPHREH